MKAQELYNLREQHEFCSGTKLHKFFETELGDPSPSGCTEIDAVNARFFVAATLTEMRGNNGDTLDGLYTSEETQALKKFIYHTDRPKQVGLEKETKIIRLTHQTFSIIRKVKRDIGYTVKLIGGIASGFDGLQYKAGDEWEYTEWEQASSRNWQGEYKASIKYDLPDFPHYVCVAWKNRTHTPLPIIVEIDDEDEYENPIQNAAVKFLYWLWNKMPFCPEPFREAVQACAYYKQQFEEVN